MDENEQKLQEALNQAAAETLRADEAEKQVKDLTSEKDRLDGEVRAMQTRLDKLEKKPDIDPDKLQRQINALQTQLAAQRKRADEAENPDRIRKLVQARVRLENQAQTVLGDKRLDDMTDRQVMVAVIERLDGKVDDDATEAYVSGCFNTLIKGHAQGAAALERVRETVQTRVDEADKKNRTDGRSARQKFKDRMLNLAFEKEA